MLVALVVVVALVAAGLAFALSGDGDDGDVAGGAAGETAGEAAGELFLEPVASVGVDPFTDPVADEPDSEREAFEAAASGPPDEGGTTSTTGAGARPYDEDGEPADPDTDDEVPAVSSLSELSLVSVEGSRPGLYGGSRERASCDVDRLVSFLEGEANRDKAEAFASVLGIDVDEIESFVSDLTPVVLGEDTAVTNHGFSEGEAMPRRSVLQRGTAVLVDDEGVPRVKCYCGNPLAPPEQLDASEAGDLEVRGEAWSAFDPAGVSSVDPADEPVDEIVLTDVDSGEMFARPVGTSGDADRDIDPTDLPGATTARGTVTDLGPLAEFPAGPATNEVTITFAPSGPAVGEILLAFEFDTGGGPVRFDYTVSMTGTFERDPADETAGTISGEGTLSFEVDLPPGVEEQIRDVGGITPGETVGISWSADVDQASGHLTGSLDIQGFGLGFEADFRGV